MGSADHLMCGLMDTRRMMSEKSATLGVAELSQGKIEPVEPCFDATEARAGGDRLAGERG